MASKTKKTEMIRTRKKARAGAKRKAPQRSRRAA